MIISNIQWCSCCHNCFVHPINCHFIPHQEEKKNEKSKSTTDLVLNCPRRESKEKVRRGADHREPGEYQRLSTSPWRTVNSSCLLFTSKLVVSLFHLSFTPLPPADPWKILDYREDTIGRALKLLPLIVLAILSSSISFFYFSFLGVEQFHMILFTL